MLGFAAAFLVAGTSIAAGATIEATNSISAWSPNSANVTTAETVTFQNTSTSTPHGLHWNAPPTTPACAGTVPVESSGTNWSGDCSFSEAGTYNFVCFVHPGMTGSVSVTSAGPSKPTVTPEAATNIKATEATLKASVNPNGEATTYKFEYGTTITYGLETSELSAGSGSSSVAKSANVSGLTAATTYHFRMVAVNETGTTNGADRTFTTAGPPSATTDPATSIGSLQATLKGTVNPKGLETKYFFNYGTTTAYGQKTAETSAGSGTSNIVASKLVTGLSPETEYHFQIVAKNTSGEIEGVDRTFTTTGGPVATTGQAIEIGEASATLTGAVNPQGQQTGFYFNYGTTSAYGQKTPEEIAGTGTSDINVFGQLTGLSPGTTYHFQVVAKNPGGTTPGDDQTFTTASAPPLPPPTPPIIETPIVSSPPDTKITGKPQAKTRDRTPTLKFSSTQPGSSFECKLDGKGYKACRSPYTTKSLSFGKHTVKVRAKSSSGAIDPSPASYSFKIVRKKR